MRDRVVHDYGQIDLEIVWETISAHLPPLTEQLREWFNRIDDEPAPENESPVKP